MAEPAFKIEDFQHMQKVEAAVMASLKPFQNGRTEGALVAIALLRIARMLLRLYPEQTQRTLLPLFIAFLRGDEEMPGAPKGLHPAFWTPPGSGN
jgi:hypothetical protein